MSAFPANPADDLPVIRRPILPSFDDGEQPVRQAAVDAVIKQNRARTPRAVLEQRKPQRLSIAELNDLDAQELQERFHTTRHDERGPVTRLIDLIDLPRNTLAGILAPHIRRRKEAEGETGALGQGRVYMSDILGDLGVKNHAVRAIAGFVGDTLLDVTTYLGPAGWGAKIGSAAGKTGQLTKAYVRAAKEAQTAFSAGREAADPLLREYIRHAAPKDADALGTALFGTGRTKTNKVLRVVGEDLEGKGGGLVTDALDDVIHPLTAPQDAARIEAAKAVYARYGRHAAPGVRIGTEGGKLAVEAGMAPGRIAAGTGYLHVPFTDISVSGPAITPRARMGIASGKLAQGVRTSGQIDPDIQAIHGLTGTVNELADESERLRRRQKELDLLGQVAEPGVAEAERGLNQQRMGEIADVLHGPFDPKTGSRTGGLVKDIGERMRTLEAKPLSDPADILFAQKMFSANDANARRLMADADMMRAMPGTYANRWKELHDEFAHLGGTREDYMRKIAPDDRAIFDMSPETIEANGKFADAFHAKMEANINLAAATQGPLDATLRARDRSVADTAKMVLGLTPDDLGYPMFAPLRAITQSLSDDREGALAAMAKGLNERATNADVAMRGAFGRRSGKVYEQMRDYLRAKSPLMNATTQEVMGNVSRDIEALVKNPAHNLSGENQVELGRLVGALIDAKDMPVHAGGDEVFKIIKEARDAGLFSETAHPGLFAEARAVADKWHDQIRSLGGLEVMQGRLGKLREAYGLPSLLTRETGERIANTKQFSAAFRGQPGAREFAGKVAESFQKQRSTDRFRWVDAEGKTREFMDGERIFTTFDKATLDRMDPEFANTIRGIQDTIKQFDAMKPSERAAVEVVPTSRFEVNRMAKEDGRFRWLTGGAQQGDFFETNAALAIADRFGASRKNYLYNRLMDFATQHGRRLENTKIKDLQAKPNGAEFTLDNGAKAALYKGKGGQPFMVIGDQRFRQLNSGLMLDSKYDPTRAILGKEGFHSLWFPEEMAELIEGSNKVFRSEEDINAVIKAADELNKLWKSVTLFHPSWTVGDLVGSLILAVHAGASPVALARHAKDAIKIVMARHRQDRGALEAIKMELAGRAVSGSDFVDMPNAGAIFGGGNAYEPAMQMLGNGQIVPAATYRAYKNPGKAIGEEWDRAAQFAEAHAGAEKWAKANKAGKVSATARSFVNDGVMRRVVAPWFQLNAIVNDWVRTAAALSFMDQGYDAASAARRVGEHMFDMTTLSETEQKLRKLAPFYAWQKNSGAYGVRMLMEDPKFFATAPKLKQALEEAANGEERLPERERPGWMRDQQAALFGRGDTRNAVLYQSLLPQEAATYFATGLGSPALGAQALQDALSYFANSLSPVIKVPLELASHREWFSKREISGSGTGDLTIPEYLASQVRPLKELGMVGVRQGPVQKAFGVGPGHGAARVVLGGRVQDASDDRLHYYKVKEFKETESALRKRIALAEREQNKGASLDARARLLRLYSEARKSGIADAVPKKLGSQSAALSAGS